jgi:hypothetical protein
MQMVRTLRLPHLVGALGMAMTHDGGLLLVAGYDATAVVRVSALERNTADPRVGVLRTYAVRGIM